MWDQLGLECIFNVTDHHKQVMWSTLQGVPIPSTYSLDMLIMRARANYHRHYEIYTINVEPDITQDDIVDLFKTNPQMIVNLVRERGYKIYSDRLDTKEVVIV